MDWILLDIIKALGWADIVSESTNWCLMSSHIIVLPLSEEADNEVSSELSGEYLSEEVDV